MVPDLVDALPENFERECNPRDRHEMYQHADACGHRRAQHVTQALQTKG
jgi:hypothetical protein